MGGPVKTVADKIELLLTEGYTSKKVRSGRGFRTIIWDTAGKQVPDLDAEWEKIRGRVASRKSQRRKAIERRASGGKIVRKPLTVAQKAVQKIRDKKRWDKESHATNLARTNQLIDAWGPRRKFTWNGKLYTKAALLRHLKQLGVKGLEELKAIRRQISGVGSTKGRTLTGQRHGTRRGVFEKKIGKLNKALRKAGVLADEFSIGHLLSKLRFPEFKNIGSNLALELKALNAAQGATATGRDLWEANRRILKDLGPAIGSDARAELNKLVAILSSKGAMTSEIEDLVNYFKGLPGVRKYKSGDYPVMNRMGKEVITYPDIKTGALTSRSAPGHARGLMNLINPGFQTAAKMGKNVHTLGGLLSLPIALGGGMIWPDKAEAIQKFAAAPFDLPGVMLGYYDEKPFSKGGPQENWQTGMGWQQSLLDPNWRGDR